MFTLGKQNAITLFGVPSSGFTGSKAGKAGNGFAAYLQQFSSFLGNANNLSSGDAHLILPQSFNQLISQIIENSNQNGLTSFPGGAYPAQNTDGVTPARSALSANLSPISLKLVSPDGGAGLFRVAMVAVTPSGQGALSTSHLKNSPIAGSATGEIGNTPLVNSTPYSGLNTGQMATANNVIENGQAFQGGLSEALSQGSNEAVHKKDQANAPGTNSVLEKITTATVESKNELGGKAANGDAEPAIWLQIPVKDGQSVWLGLQPVSDSGMQGASLLAFAGGQLPKAVQNLSVEKTPSLKTTVLLPDGKPGGFSGTASSVTAGQHTRQMSQPVKSVPLQTPVNAGSGLPPQNAPNPSGSGKGMPLGAGWEVVADGEANPPQIAQVLKDLTVNRQVAAGKVYPNNAPANTGLNTLSGRNSELSATAPLQNPQTTAGGKNSQNNVAAADTHNAPNPAAKAVPAGSVAVNGKAGMQTDGSNLVSGRPVAQNSHSSQPINSNKLPDGRMYPYRPVTGLELNDGAGKSRSGISSQSMNNNGVLPGSRQSIDQAVMGHGAAGTYNAASAEMFSTTPTVGRATKAVVPPQDGQPSLQIDGEVKHGLNTASNRGIGEVIPQPAKGGKLNPDNSTIEAVQNTSGQKKRVAGLNDAPSMPKTAEESRPGGKFTVAGKGMSGNPLKEVGGQANGVATEPQNGHPGGWVKQVDLAKGNTVDTTTSKAPVVSEEARVSTDSHPAPSEVKNNYTNKSALSENAGFTLKNAGNENDVGVFKDPADLNSPSASEHVSGKVASVSQNRPAGLEIEMKGEAETKPAELAENSIGTVEKANGKAALTGENALRTEKAFSQNEAVGKAELLTGSTGNRVLNPAEKTVSLEETIPTVQDGQKAKNRRDIAVENSKTVDTGLSNNRTTVRELRNSNSTVSLSAGGSSSFKEISPNGVSEQQPKLTLFVRENGGWKPLDLRVYLENRVEGNSQLDAGNQMDLAGGRDSSPLRLLAGLEGKRAMLHTVKNAAPAAGEQAPIPEFVKVNSWAGEASNRQVAENVPFNSSAHQKLAQAESAQHTGQSASPKSEFIEAGSYENQSAGIEPTGNQIQSDGEPSTFEKAFELGIIKDRAAHHSITSNRPVSGSAPTAMLYRSLEEPTQMVKELARQMQGMLLRNGREMVVQLRPENLGLIRVRLQGEKEKMHARIETTTPEVQHLLQKHQTELIQRLADQEISLENLEFSLLNSFKENKNGQSGLKGGNGNGHHIVSEEVETIGNDPQMIKNTLKYGHSTFEYIA